MSGETTGTAKLSDEMLEVEIRHAAMKFDDATRHLAQSQKVVDEMRLKYSRLIGERARRVARKRREGKEA